MNSRPWVLLGAGCLMLLTLATAATAAERGFRSLFNGRDLSGWDKWLGPASGGYHDPKTSKEKPLGLNHDPMGVFTVTNLDGAPVIRVSGQVFGAITSREEFGNVRIRVEYKWGRLKWPPRDEPRHYRDSGMLYWCVGPHGVGSYAWMQSVECNIMEKGVGQWWAVDGTRVDIEGRKVTLEKDPRIPYRGEGPGEQCILYEPGGPQFTTGEGITSLLDPEKPGEWNTCEVVAWGNIGLHLLNGQVVMALANPRYGPEGHDIPLNHGRIQLQSEGAEVFFRRVEVKELDEVPVDLLSHIPPGAPGETGFVPLFDSDSNRGWAQCGPGRVTVRGGVATGEGGMGLWWYTNRTFTNFVLRGEFLQEQPIADSGIFLRFPNPGNDPWSAVHKGHEVEIGDETSDKPTWWTGSLYPFHAPTGVKVHPPGQWNQYEIVCTGQNYLVRLNGRVVNTWTDRQRRTASGYLGLQNYNDGKTVRHRNVRVRDLP